MGEIENDNDLFAEKLSEVLENVAFIFTEELSSKEIETEPGVSLAARIAFDGEGRGKAMLACQLPLCETIALNILGSEQCELSDSTVADALKEVLNIACGQFLTARFGTQPVFNLTVPDVSKISGREWLEFSERPGVRVCLAEEWQMLSEVSIEESS